MKFLQELTIYAAALNMLFCGFFLFFFIGWIQSRDHVNPHSDCEVVNIIY